jgi:hypothetical protein
MYGKLKDTANAFPQRTRLLLIMCFYFLQVLLFKEKHFISLSTLGKAYRGIIYGFYIFPATTPLGL